MALPRGVWKAPADDCDPELRAALETILKRVGTDNELFTASVAIESSPTEYMSYRLRPEDAAHARRILRKLTEQS